MNQSVRAATPPIPFIDVVAQRRRLGRAIDDAVARVLDPLSVHPRAGGRGVREGAGRFLRRAPRGRLRQRHRCAGAGADGEGHRAGRRGDLPVFHLLRHRRSRRSASARRRCSSMSMPTTFNIDRGQHCRARSRPPSSRPQAEGVDPGRSVRPAGRLRCDRCGRPGGRPVRAR